MLSALRASSYRSVTRSFSTSASRHADLAKLTLIGRLVNQPEIKRSKNDQEYVAYTVATANYPPPPKDVNGERQASSSTFHRILSFYEKNNAYLATLTKGSKVYVEAAFELKDPLPDADPATPQGQRQIFLRHESIRVLDRPRPRPEESEHEEAL